MQLGFNRVSLSNSARRLAARLSIALAAASCGSSAPHFKDGLRPAISHSGERTVISGSREQIIKQLVENQDKYFQAGTVQTVTSDALDYIKNYVFRGILQLDLTIILSPKDISFTLKEGTEFKFDGTFDARSNEIEVEKSLSYITATLAQETTFTIFNNQVTLQSGDKIDIFNDGIAFNVSKDIKFLIKGLEVTFRSGPLLWKYDNSIRGRLAHDTGLMVNGVRVHFSGGSDSYSSSLELYGNGILASGTLLHDTAFTVNGNKVVFRGNTSIDFYPNGRPKSGSLLRDTEFNVNGNNIVFVRDNPFFLLYENGIPANGTLARDTEIDGISYAGYKSETADNLFWITLSLPGTVSFHPSGRVESGCLARPMTAEGIRLLAGEKICHAEGGNLLYQRPLFPEENLALSLMCDKSFAPFEGGILMSEVKLPIALFMERHPSMAGKVEDYASYLPPLKIIRGNKVEDVKMNDVLDILRQSQDLVIPPNTIDLYFDDKGSPRKIRFIRDLKINNTITIPAQQQISLDITVIPAIFRGAVTSTIVELLSEANPGLAVQ